LLADGMSRPTPGSPQFASLDSRATILNDTFDDLAVLCGLVVAGRAPRRLIAEAIASGNLQTQIDRIAGGGEVAAAEWGLLQQLWYRWRVPWGAASLHWWHLFCTAFGRCADAGEATDLFSDWLEKLDIADVVDRVAAHCELTGRSARAGIAAVRDDVSAIHCFLGAALHGVPLVKIWSDDELVALKAAGIRVIVSDDSALETDTDGAALPEMPAQRPEPHNMELLCRGRRPRLAGLDEETRDWWRRLSPEDRTYTLVHLEQKLACLEQVRFSYGNIVTDNDGIAATLKACRGAQPGAWTRAQLAAATFCLLWQEAGFCVQEISQAEIHLATVRIYMERRVADYVAIAGSEVELGLGLVDLARRLASLRAVVEKTHQRCLYFDGSNWERREFLVTRDELATARRVPAALADALQRKFDVPVLAGDAYETLRLYTGELATHGHNPSDLLVAIAEWAANATDVVTDYAIFTVPRGVNLDQPWDLKVDELFCYTAFRSGFDAGAAGVPLRTVGICNAIGQRMRYNAMKKAQNYALVKHMTPQSFLLPDIAVAEDAHQSGHYFSGVRHSCRVPMAVDYRGSHWKGIADVRLSRTGYHRSIRFTERDLTLACRYGIWSRAVADEAYARDILFDYRYCVNLDDGRNIVAKLGRA
jgi:hypothetical protein